MVKKNNIYQGKSNELLLSSVDDNCVDLVYMDPPFYTQKKHKLKTKDSSKEYVFNDEWKSIDEYLLMIREVLIQSQRVLKKTGSIFLHCDKAASHHLRVLLDDVFGKENFQSEIIWTYKRWSNSKKGLLNSHQNIYFYSKTKNFKFNTIYTDYSATTNIDQILQDRVRNKDGKSAYKLDKNGDVVLGREKKGVPLSDVWSIPYLNPKAKERVGYPTQKPVLLLNQIVSLVTDEDDLVLDPFCGSGTTCVSAKFLCRDFIGIDQSKDAVELARKRVEDMIISGSQLLEKGEESYMEKNEKTLAFLKIIDAVPVQRNSGIDGFLKSKINNKPIPIKIQASDETLESAIEKLESASIKNCYEIKIVIQTSSKSSKRLFPLESDAIIVRSQELMINKAILDFSSNHNVMLNRTRQIT